MSTYDSLRLLQLIDQMPGDFANLPGEVFSTGALAMAPGDLYVVGLNPGFGNVYPTIRDHVAEWSLESFSAFTDQCWNERCWNTDCRGLQVDARCTCQRGTHPHQIAVRRIVERARPGLDIRSVFATNAIFARSHSADSFSTEVGLSLGKAFSVCWPIHRYFLSIVRPRVIVSLGYMDGSSAFDLFKRKASLVSSVDAHFVPGRKFASFKWAEMTFELEAVKLSALVVGVRHPSYVPDAADNETFAHLVAKPMTQKANPRFQPTAFGGG